MDLISAGRTILLRDRKMGNHLFFVLTDPDPTTRKVVVVALVTERDHTEKTVRLDVGDHAFIQHGSNVTYGTATFFPVSRLNDALADGRARLQDDMSPSLLTTVRDGLLKSSYTPHAVADYCRPLFDPKPKKGKPGKNP